jgi:hypothetical protein
MKKRVGRPPGRKAPRRPVISARVPLPYYELIKQAAQFSGRTISEEVAWRTMQSFERDKTLEAARKEAQQLIAETMRAQQGAFEELMSKKFEVEYHLTGTYWRERGAPPMAMRPELIPEFKAAITDAIKEGYASLKEELK